MIGVEGRRPVAPAVSRFGSPIVGRRAKQYAAALAILTMALPHTVYAAEPQVRDGESAPAKAWRLAMERGDLTALSAMHDDRTISFPPGETEVKGARSILKGYADLFAHYRIDVKVEEAHWIEVAPLVVSWGLTTLTLHPKSGGPDVVSRTRYTDAAIATGDHWRYVVDHASKPSAK